MNPYTQTLRPIDLNTVVTTARMPFLGALRVSALVDTSEVGRHISLDGAEAEGEILGVAVADDLATGEYLTVLIESFGAKARKAPGFLIEGRPFVGCGVILRGVETVCPGLLSRLIDRHEDLALQEGADKVTWRSVKGIDGERGRYKDEMQARKGLLKEEGQPELIVLSRNMDALPLPCEKAATCFCCGKRRAALSKCSLCLDAYYCDDACQLKHWRVHKPLCVKR